MYYYQVQNNNATIFYCWYSFNDFSYINFQMIPAKLDEFGREISKPIDTWSPRRGVSVALTQLAPLLKPENIGELIEFFVSSGLGDRKEKVRKEMLTAALKVVDIHGKETVGTLLPVFEKFMDKSSKSAQYDAVKQAVVILMGSLARHLDKDDERIKPIVLRLVSALSTPSQTVSFYFNLYFKTNTSLPSGVHYGISTTN